MGKSVSILILGLCIAGVHASAAYTAQGPAADSVLADMAHFQEVVSDVTGKVGAAVVSISTQRTTRVSGLSRSVGDEMLDQFFRDFIYGDIPQREYTRIGLGSGVIIDQAGYIITNEHVISGAEKITVTLVDGRVFEGTLKSADRDSDLAVIKIDAENLPYAVLGNSDDVKPGQWAIAIGNPFGFAAKNPKPAVTLGIISTVHRSLPHASGRDRAYSDLIQTDAAINPGNSGGPLVTINAEVVGINAAIVGTGGGSLGIGFAIPVNNAKAILNKLLKGEEVLSGWFGIAVQDLNQALADYFRLRTSQGVLVISVIPDSPADKSGIQPEDAIIKFDEVTVQNTLELLRLLGKKNTGDIVKIKIMRNGLPRTLKVTLGKQPDRDNAAEIGVRNESPAPEESAAAPEVTELKSWRGLSVAAITAENAGNLNLPDDKGVIVTEVSAESGAERAGCKVNDIITQVNTIMIGSLSDYIRAVANADGNVLIKTNRGYLMIPE